MAGLVGYASSDEDEPIEQPKDESPAKKEPQGQRQIKKAQDDLNGAKHPVEGLEKDQQMDATPSLAPIGPVPQSDVPLGPSLPPQGEAYLDEQPELDMGEPGSPYSANRALLHNLTLPSVPDLDIPPSPPGSPPPATNKKFEQFLDLKKKGVHFNTKLENSTALRNPSLMDKLMGFVDIDERGQYETTLSADLWNPGAFPESAFRGKLRESHDILAKEREAERAGGGRTGVDFVSSTTSSAGGSSTNTPVGLSKPGTKRKGGWK